MNFGYNDNEKYDKSELRSYMKSMRRNLSNLQAAMMSEAICNRIKDIEAFRAATSIYCYMPCNNEVDTRMLMQDATKRSVSVYIPKVCQSRQMQFYMINDLENDIKTGAFGISEPDEAKCTAANYKDCNTAVVIVPGVAFDLSCGRVGYGGGYYDTFLAKYPEIYKIAPAYDFQVVPGMIEREDTDIGVDMIVTEKRIITVKV